MVGALPPIDLAAIAQPDHGHEHDAVVEVGNDPPIADPIFPEIAELLAPDHKALQKLIRKEN